MKVLKIKAFQLFSCYRKPFSYGFWDTFPLPPFSTLAGWFHHVIEASQFHPMNIGVIGKIDNITYDLQKLIKFDRVRKKPGETVLEGFNKVLSQTPTYVANLTHIQLWIYFQTQMALLEKFKESLLTRRYPSLGRYEDLLRIDAIDFVELENKQLRFSEPLEINYAIYIKPETARLNGLQGINYQLPFKYEIKNDLRYFQKENVVFLDSGGFFRGHCLIDRNVQRDFDEPVLVELFGQYLTP